jgi:hypothetical protein
MPTSDTAIDDASTAKAGIPRIVNPLLAAPAAQTPILGLAGCGSMWKLNIIPLSWSSAIWQRSVGHRDGGPIGDLLPDRVTPNQTNWRSGRSHIRVAEAETVVSSDLFPAGIRHSPCDEVPQMKIAAGRASILATTRP